ncbi:MAG: TonB-dependent receptor [Chitinophagaceae bacterium]
MRKPRWLSLIAFFLLSIQITFAQNREISGKITNEQGAPVANASISIRGTNKGTVSQADGTYRISVPPGTTVLVFSSVDLGSKEVTIGSQTEINVTLKLADKSLQEVVVVGYGTKIKKDLTGSVANVTSKEVNNTPATSFESAIQGRASGVYVQQQNGKLGQGINIRIRGASSVTAGNEPLYVVDGIPVTAADLSTNGATTNSLADINMNDIESIQILKDASSAAIYGSQASNGVVLITTKKGKSGTSKIEFNYFTGLQKPTGYRKFLDTKQWLDYMERAARGAATQDVLAGYYSTYDEALPDEIDFVEGRFTRYSAGNDDWKTAKVNTNWQDQAFQRAPISQYDLNVSGGTDRTKFFLSGQLLDQSGIIKSNFYKRYSTRLNIDHQVKPWLNIGMNLNFSRSRNDRVSNDDQFSTPLQIVALSPITPLIDPRTGLTTGALDPNTGRPNTNYPVYYNPMLSVLDAYYKTSVNRTFGNVYGNVSFSKALTFRTEFGVDQLNQVEEDYNGTLTARNTSVPKGNGSNYLSQVLNYTTNNFFNFKKTFAEIHDIDAVLGMSYQQRDFENNGATAEVFPSNAYKKLIAGASKTQATSYNSSSSLLSYFARLGYKLNDKYLVSLSGRIDGSSRFGANNRYGFFPAASLGWIVSEESFLKDNVNWLSFLKLKASYGLTGNDQIPDYAARGLYSAVAYGGDAGQVKTQLPNDDLKWESTAGTDVGIEGGLFSNRISFELDYYYKKTKDLLLNVDVPGTSGFASKYENVGTMENKGIELSINTTNIATRKFRWTTMINFAANKNKVLSLDGQVIGDDVNKAREGQPLGVFYAREFAGADPANGDALYYKNTVGTDGKIDHTTTNDYNAAQDVRIGNPNPKFIYGFGNTFTYKSLDLDVLLQGVYGNQIFNGGGQYMSSSGSNGFDNQTIDQLGYWDKPGDITMVPEPRLFYPNGTNNSSRYISTGSYLRVKAVTLGFNLPKQVLNKIHIDRLRLYLRAQNLFTITKYKGWDPEVNADYQATNINQGVDFYSAPQLKTIVFGLSIGL